MKNILTASLMLLVMTMSVMAQEKFCIAKNGNTAAIVVDEQDWKGVARAANDLGDDVRKVCGTACSVVSAMSTDKPNIVVGTIGKSSIINKFIKQKKLDVNKVKGQWESFVIDVVDGNLVVAGSDKRGTSMASMR
jgi:putative ribosome biogenesis GTPase RsgA